MSKIPLVTIVSVAAWLAVAARVEPRYGKFKNDPSLSVAEIPKVTA